MKHGKDTKDLDEKFLRFYYEQQIKRELKEIHICGCLWYDRLRVKTDGSTRLGYTGLLGELEHLKTEMRLIGESFECVMHMVLCCQIH